MSEQEWYRGSCAFISLVVMTEMRAFLFGIARAAFFYPIVKY